MRVLLAAMLLLVCAACSGDDRGGERFALYHLEAAIGPPGAEGELSCGPPSEACPGVLAQPPPHVFHYDVRQPPAVAGDDIDLAHVTTATDPATGAGVLLVALTPVGRKAFARLTREVARIGGRDQGWHHVAVVVGDEIVAFPEIDFDVYPNGIANAPAVQVTTTSTAEARDLADRLEPG
jgi:hypothetical protein